MEEFSIHAICAIHTLDKRPRVFIRDKPILTSERTLRKNYNRKDSVIKALVVILKGLGAKTK
jgi:hypothetical protein